MKSLLSISAILAASILMTPTIASAQDEDSGSTANWAGLYVGGHIGHASVDTNADFGDDEQFSQSWWGDYWQTYREGYDYSYKTDNDADGFLGGAHIGYSIQRGSLVFGIEGDLTKTDSSVGYEEKTTNFWHWAGQPDQKNVTGERVDTLEYTMNYLASIRGRVGYASGKFLVFATGGVAFTEIDENFKRVDNGVVTYESSEGKSFTGFVVGGGAAYQLSQRLSLRGEVLHYSFDDKPVELDATVLRTGLTFKLN